MADSKTIEILKGAIILEERGKAFYESIVNTTESAAVREIFTNMVLEEIKHANFLIEQYEHLVSEGSIKNLDLSENPAKINVAVLTKKVKNEISGAGYEAAAISAALELEKKAVAYYSERADTTKDREEKKLYQWLADWEKTHMNLLAAIDDELREKIWYDQHFWPII